MVIRNGSGIETAVIDAGGDALDEEDPGYTPSGGDLKLKNINGIDTIHLDGGIGDLRLGSYDLGGSISIGRPGNNNPSISISGSTGGISIKQSRGGGIRLSNSSGVKTVQIDGEAGDVIFSNADFAEEFEVLESIRGQIEPGMVMALNEEGKLLPCSSANDKKIVGVVSGAGNHKPGIVMDKRLGQGHRLPIALVGKVMCRADASFGEIKVGDLLTSSTTFGHAMRVENPYESIGCVLGKALSPLKEGVGLVSMLSLK